MNNQTSREAFNKKDVLVNTWTSAELSGFNVRIPNGVKVKHIPTQIEVTCEDDRSQHKNLHSALKELERLVLERASGVAAKSPSEQEFDRFIAENPNATPLQVWQAATQWADK